MAFAATTAQTAAAGSGATRTGPGGPEQTPHQRTLKDLQDPKILTNPNLRINLNLTGPKSLDLQDSTLLSHKLIKNGLELQIKNGAQKFRITIKLNADATKWSIQVSPVGLRTEPFDHVACTLIFTVPKVTTKHDPDTRITISHQTTPPSTPPITAPPQDFYGLAGSLYEELPPPGHTKPRASTNPLLLSEVAPPSRQKSGQAPPPIPTTPRPGKASTPTVSPGTTLYASSGPAPEARPQQTITYRDGKTYVLGPDTQALYAVPTKPRTTQAPK